MNRVLAQGDRRPMAGHPAAMHELQRLLRDREPLYALAHVTIDTSRGGLAGALKAALEALT
jgi:XRE family aerobic/anaerobic benzoate catabolism transcriptional regulator